MKRLAVIVMVAVFLSLAGAVVVKAQGANPPATPVTVSDNDVNRVAKQLYCPVCPNTPLDVCETQACQEWRAQIKDQLGQGWSDQQVIEYFVAQYGERVLAEPKRSGFTSFVWILPVVALAIGLFVLTQLLRAWKAQRTVPAGVPAPMVTSTAIAPEVLERLEKELREIA